MRRTRTRLFLRAALVAALVAAGALIAVPIGPVPVTLQVLVIAVAVLVLTPAEALLALVAYLAVGAMGAPVFSGGTGGVGVLVGPTGGFLLGFLAGAPAGALVRTALAGAARRPRPWLADVLALLTFIVVTYGMGWAYFAVVTGRTAADAFAVAVAPFVVIDLLKCAAAWAVARAVRAAGLGAD
ncbi:MAG: biotin transporter BioY [Coriobacteriia bacterium]|nr:biotin transporter BioY [Coriobacteriia bacterium]